MPQMPSHICQCLVASDNRHPCTRKSSDVIRAKSRANRSEDAGGAAVLACRRQHFSLDRKVTVQAV